MGISQKIARYSRLAAPHVRSKADFFSLRVLEQDLFVDLKDGKRNAGDFRVCKQKSSMN